MKKKKPAAAAPQERLRSRRFLHKKSGNGHKISIRLFSVFLGLSLRLAGQVHSQLLENAFVHGGEHDGGMNLTAAKLPEGAQRKGRPFVRRRADGKGDQDFIRVQPGIDASQIGGFQGLDRFDGRRGCLLYTSRCV